MIAYIKIVWALLPKWLTDFVTGLAWALAAIALGMLLLKVGDYQGRVAERMACKAEKTEELQKAFAQYDAEIKEGRNAVAALITQRNQLAAERDALQRRLARVPQTVPTPQCPDPGAVHLTLGAVRLWNSDLGYPGLPAGACGAAGGPGGAEAADGPCAGDSGIGLEQARENAKENFRAGAAIRAQCQSLIDHLKRRERAAPSTFPTGELNP